MDNLSWYTFGVVGFPLLAVLLTALLGARVLRQASHWPVVVALALSFVCSMLLFQELRLERDVGGAAAQAHGIARVIPLWSWLDIEQAAGGRDFRLQLTLRADPLTSMMQMMVTGISLCVAVFSIGYMRDDRGYWRFFSYIGLFVFSMTMLVTVSSFLWLFVFWEAVGVCSYLLIGFWYQRPSAAQAGMKAFIVNRVGDFGLTIAIFLIWLHYGTLDFHDAAWEQTPSGEVTVVTDAGRLSQLASAAEMDGRPSPVVEGVLGQRRIESGGWVGGGVGLAICLLLMCGACGKSAQFPLHVWLPDAMEGPTPVSALIHAATMVTAGVYLVVRCAPLFVVSPAAQAVVSGVGAFTALLAALIALTQFDLKRVLAYSTISQLGYMFLGVGVGSLAGITAGMFHLFTHAFFKALLFLGAGSVMHAMGNVIDMRRFGGLRKLMPYTHATFFIGALALAGVFPLSGFWSKDAIMGAVHDRMHVAHAAPVEGVLDGGDVPAEPGEAGGLAPEHHAAWTDRVYTWSYYAALFTVWLTAFYTFRAVWMTFYGEERIPAEAGSHAHESPPSMVVPLVVLAAGAAVAGLLLDRSALDGTHPFGEWIAAAPSLSLPALRTGSALGTFHPQVAAISTVVALFGIGLSAHLYLGPRDEVKWLRAFFDLAWLDRYMATDAIATFGVRSRTTRWGVALRRTGLTWVLELVIPLVLMVVLVIATPLVVLRFISPYRLSANKFYIDQLYAALVVIPLRCLATVCAWLDRVVVDGLVDLVGWLPKAVGGVLRSVQNGLIPFYSLAMVVAVAVLWWVRVCLM